MKLFKRLRRNVALIFQVWDAVKFLDLQCMGIKVSNATGQFIGYWNCDGNFLETVEEARRRIGAQTTAKK